LWFERADEAPPDLPVASWEKARAIIEELRRDPQAFLERVEPPNQA
jgi:hypothetical protein